MRIKKLTSSIFVLPVSVLFFSLVSLNGCSSDGEERPEYMDANSVESLQIPPKLTRPDTSGALRLPEPSGKALNMQNESKAIAPIFKGIELKNDSRLYWLEIEKPVEEVWATLPRFLASEGIELDRVEKLFGFVDTSWMNEYQITYGGKEGDSSWFVKFSPDYKDKFRIRVEAITDTDKTRLFVSHRGLQVSVTDDESEWIYRNSEPLLEREIMYRYVLFAGAGQNGATTLLANYKSYQPRAQLNSENPSIMKVQGDPDTVWLRLSIALDRLGVDTVNSDKAAGKLEVQVGNIKVPEKKQKKMMAGLVAYLVARMLRLRMTMKY